MARNVPDAAYPLEPIENRDVMDASAPWASAPDDASDDGRGPKPMAVPDDLYSEPSSEGTKEEPKGTVIPVWMFLTVAVMASVLGATAVSGPAAGAAGLPPSLLFDPSAPIAGTPPTLPNLPNPPALPCPQDAGCGFIMKALEPVFPPQTRALLNVPGTCQNWSREWLRTGKDVMEFEIDRIRQRFAMALMYCEFNGDNWLEGELWVSDLHECDWYSMIGVDPCSRNEKYQIIRNYGQQMRGTLPPELSMISSLWEITLSDNLISGEIPSDFVKLSQLDTMVLSFNLFEGPIPEFMWKFEDMTYLDLAYNFFTGTIPNDVHLTEKNLRVLFLENNDLSGSIPSTLGSLNWQRLYLDGNELTGPVPADINSPNMEELRLHNNRLTGTFPAESFANDNPGKSKLREVTLYSNGKPDVPDSGITGNFKEMCRLQYEGKLQLLEVDNPSCECCTGPP
jgi:hypothetical protein